MHPNSMTVLHRFISTKENKLMFVVTWGSELTFSWHSTTLCAQVLEKENWDLGTIYSCYAGSHRVKLASKLLYFNDFHSEIFKVGSCRNFESGLY